jgi:hypothetical protein
MPRRNRIDPWGDLHAVSGRGLFTGNRGCLVDERGRTVRHHRGPLWITCLLEYQGWKHPLDRPQTWTPIFFLDDAVALAAGHRPCGLCRRRAYLDYRDAVSRAEGSSRPPGAGDLNRRLARERLRRGRGLERAGDRIVWVARIESLPNGTVVVGTSRAPLLVVEDRLMSFSFGGWANSSARPRQGSVEVITPPTSVAAMRHGFEPVLHPSANR